MSNVPAKIIRGCGGEDIVVMARAIRRGRASIRRGRGFGRMSRNAATGVDGGRGGWGRDDHKNENARK
jgi:hypothetical protein